MNNFSSKLWYDKRWVSKTGEASLYLQITIDGKHDEFPLKIRWPVAKIDIAHGVLLKRSKHDEEFNDYNLIRMEYSAHTDILRTYRLKRQHIDLGIFARELNVYEQRESFTKFMLRKALNRYKEKDIVKRTWQNHRSAYELAYEFNQEWSFNELTFDWMTKFKGWLRHKDYEPGHVWTTIKTIKAYLKLAKKDPMLFVANEVHSFSNPEPKWKTNYLNKTEIRNLIELFKKKELDLEASQVLAAFLFTCFTSLCISDVYRLGRRSVVLQGYRRSGKEANPVVPVRGESFL